MGRARARGRRLVLGAGLSTIGIALLLLILAVVMGRSPPAWVPTPVQNLAYDVRLLVAPLAKKALTVSRMSLPDSRVYLDRLDRYDDVAGEAAALSGTLFAPRARVPTRACSCCTGPRRRADDWASTGCWAGSWRDAAMPC